MQKMEKMNLKTEKMIHSCEIMDYEDIYTGK